MFWSSVIWVSLSFLKASKANFSVIFIKRSPSKTRDSSLRPEHHAVQGFAQNDNIGFRNVILNKQGE
jgi:hypothetical protein